MFNIFNLKDEIKQNFENRGKDTASAIPTDDLERINNASSYMWKVPLLFGTIYGITTKVISMLGVPMVFNNPLKESVHVN